MASVILPPGLSERVSALVDRLIRRAPAALGGFSNLVFLIDDDLVVKAASSPPKRVDLAREAMVLRSVADLELGAPELVRASSDEEWAIVVTRVAPGQSAAADWGRFAYEVGADPDRGFRLGRGIGHRLRRIHDAAPFPGVGGARIGGTSGAMRVDLLAETAKALADRRQHGERIPDDLCAQMISALTDAAQQRGGALLHGDFGFHNLLLDDPFGGFSVTAVLDWELSTWGNALTDVAWLSWTLALRRISEMVWKGFVAAYGDWALTALGWDAEVVRGMVLAQMAVLLVRTEPETAVRQIWIDRARSVGEFQVPSIA
jgi:aminoglycoside phosphotransferase (APT) family kinase protein